MSFAYPIVTAVDPAGRRAALQQALEAGQEFILLLPEGVTLSEEMLQAFAAAAKAAPADAAVLAARVLPWGPDWHCDPITLEADCVRLEAVLLNCMLAFAAGGFDKHLTGAAADADLCWRLRGAGCRLLYCPQIVAEDSRAGSDTLENYIAGVRSAAMLRAAYGKTGSGLRTLTDALRAPRHFPGVRKALAKALPAAALHTLRAGLTPAPLAALNYAMPTEPGFGPQRGRCALTAEARAAIAAEQPLVSVVIRTCSRPDTLRETLKCLYHQTYKNFEIVIVEDGAPTAEAMVAEEFVDLPIRYHSTGKNVGRGRAGNWGIELAKGKYVAFLDDDDFYYPDFIELHLAKLLTGRRPAFVISSIMAFEVDVASRSPYVYTVKKRYPVIFDHITLMDMCVKCRIPMTGGMFLRELYDTCGGMREDIDGDEDWCMWLRYWRADGRTETVADLPRAVSMFGYPADPEKAAARLAAYEIFDEQMLADEALTFRCTAAEVESWRATVAADCAHLARVGGLAALRADAEKHEALPLPKAAEEPRTLSAKQINRYYWYLVKEYTKE